MEPSRPCSYLPDQRASLELAFDPHVTAESYGELLRRGYRRFGWQMFRPACCACRKCISLRVLLNKFEISASDRRVIRQNEEIRCDLAPISVTEHHVELFNQYQSFMHVEKGWPLQSHTPLSYGRAFVAGPQDVGWEWKYFDGNRLVGVSLLDVVPGAISLVYFYYDPSWRRHSPGRFSILHQLRFAKQQGLSYAYLGYWVEACGSLNYKSRFRPYETLERYVFPEEEPVWVSSAEAGVIRRDVH